MAERSGRLADNSGILFEGEFGLEPQRVFNGGPGRDRFAGTPAADVVDGGAGPDELRGGGNADRIHGGTGDDVISGDAGADTLSGGPGRDRITGGDGNDAIRGGPQDDVIDGGRGDDALDGHGGNDLVRAGAGNDRVSGHVGADRLFGDAGNDLVAGGTGNDRQAGGTGNDTLLGGPGRDRLNGQQGNDILDGEDALDILTGGGGRDIFRFTELDGNLDVVTDFNPRTDRLDLSDVLTGFDAGDRVRDFVRFEIAENGTQIAVRPQGSGAFEPLALLQGVEVRSLSAEQLGLESAPPAGREIASSNARGQPGNGISFAPSLSTDGAFVVFSSSSTNLTGTADDNRDTFDVFRKNLETGEVVRVSETRIPGVGVVGGNEDSFFTAVAGNGQVVAFASGATNFSLDDTGTSDVFVRDLAGQTVEFVSIAGNRVATEPSMSADGNLVAMEVTATGRAETGNATGEIIPRIYVRDLESDGLIEASTARNGRIANRASSNPDISSDGRFVAFESNATNLAGEDTNPRSSDVFVKNLQNGSIQVASTGADGAQGFGGSGSASISGDGRLVAFQSEASFDVADRFNQQSDIYVKNLRTGAIELVTINNNGILANGDSFSPSISNDGRFVAFRSAASNLVAGDNNGQPDIFVKDLQTDRFLRFELESDTTGARAELVEPVLSGDGSRIAFIDRIEVNDQGGLSEGQVIVAPVGFRATGQALTVADVLAGGPADAGAGAPVGAGPAVSVDHLLADPVVP